MQRTIANETSEQSPRLWTRQRTAWIFWGYLLLIAGAEYILTYVSLSIGHIAHVLLLLGLLLYGWIGPDTTGRRLALTLVLVPLIRILSLSLPLAAFPQHMQYLIVGGPLLFSTWLTIRHLRLSRAQIGMRLDNVLLQLMLAGGSLGLGLIEYRILQPEPLASEFTWHALWLPAVSLIIFTGFTEELIFRGVIQAVALPLFRFWGLIYGSLLFAVLHISYRSVPEVLFTFGVGLLFACVVYQSGSLVGVTLMHGLSNATFFLVWPQLAQAESGELMPLVVMVAQGGSLLAFIAFVIIMVRPRKVQHRSRVNAIKRSA